MRKNNLVLIIMVALLATMLSSVFAQMGIGGAGMIGELPVVKRDKYATFLTLATFDGIKGHKCMGLTALCPDKCGHSGDMAIFTIDKTLAYGKYNQYGDAKTGKFSVLIKNTISENPLVPQNIYDQIKELKKGDKVLLSWNHDYVTAGGNSFPERPINFIYSLTDKQANSISEVTVMPNVADVASKLSKYTVLVAKYDGKEGNNAVFSNPYPIYTYHYADAIAAVFQMTYAVDLTKADKSVLKGINGLKKIILL